MDIKPRSRHLYSRDDDVLDGFRQTIRGRDVEVRQPFRQTISADSFPKNWDLALAKAGHWQHLFSSGVLISVL